MIIPSKQQLYFFLGLATLALLASFFPEFETAWLIGFVVLLVVLLLDLAILFLPIELSCQRNLPGSLSLGVNSNVELIISNDGHSKRKLAIFDHYPSHVQAQGLPMQLILAGNEKAALTYQIKATERGKLIFPLTQIHSSSLLGFWFRNVKVFNESETYVYPNFAAVSQYALMATDNRLSQMGIIKKRRRGEGQDFHQLREYREGDALNQIDWKATSRMRKIISREYQDERDQEIIFLLDCGHRMTTKDEGLSHFDHTLNAILLLSYVALKQGDAVGIGTFSGESRWVSPKKGLHNLHAILNTIYDLQPSAESPDYSQAAADLLVKHKKRALIILLTNLRDEDTDDLLPALSVLKRRHLVLLASMREEATDKTLEQPVNDFNQAILVASTHHYLQYRAQCFEKIRTAGVISMDIPPTQLSVELINQYLTIKSSGAL